MRNSRQILVASLKDIRAGKWVCGDLCSLPSEYGETCPANPTQKDLMGCALGLVAIHGDDTEVDRLYFYNADTDEGKYVELNIAKYADGNSSDAVRRAIHALFKATPLTYQKKWAHAYDRDDLDGITETLNNAVFEYNDGEVGGRKTKKGRESAAIKWFERAISILPTVRVPEPAPALETVESESLSTIA